MFCACVVRGAFVSGPTTSREKKTTATFFLGFVCLSSSCVQYLSVGLKFECDEIHSVVWRDNLKLENSPQVKKSSKEKRKKVVGLKQQECRRGVLCCCCCCFYCVRSCWVRGPGLPTLLPTLSRSHSFLYIAELSSASSSSSSCPSSHYTQQKHEHLLSSFLFEKNKQNQNKTQSTRFFWVVSLPPDNFCCFRLYKKILWPPRSDPGPAPK